MKNFLWASVHAPTPTQLEQLGGKVTLLADISAGLQNMLTNSSDDVKELEAVAHMLLDLCYSYNYTLVQPSGSLAFQFVLANMRQKHWPNGNIGVLYAHSERVSQDEPQADGSVKKVSVFKHVKFIEL